MTSRWVRRQSRQRGLFPAFQYMAKKVASYRDALCLEWCQDNMSPGGGLAVDKSAPLDGCVPGQLHRGPDPPEWEKKCS